MIDNKFLFFLIPLLFLLYSCSNNRWEENSEHIHYEPTVKRTEQDYFPLGADGFTNEELNSLKTTWPNFHPLYFGSILRLGNSNEAGSMAFEASQLFRNEDVQALYQSVHQEFPESDLKHEMDELTEALKQTKVHFPEVILPKVYTLISLFAYNTIVDDSLLGISLDMYLGGDFKYYPSTGIPQYKFKNFEREFLVSDALKAFLIAEFDKDAGLNLLEEMIFAGKIAYLQSAFMKSNTNLLFNYTEDELSWCEDNEAEIWFHFVDMELLYSSESSKIRKYIDDAPFIPGFPEGSTARVGKWIGYRIVQEYMDRHPQKSLKDLMAQKDANEILLASKYKPKR